MNFIDNHQPVYAGDAVSAASNTDDDGDAVDTAGYDGVAFLCAITDSVDTGVATMTAEQCDTSGGTYAALSGAIATATSAANDDLNTKYLVVDVHRPRERYVRVNRTSATANIAYSVVTAILYQGSKFPVSQDSDEVAHAVTVVSPAES